MDFLFGLYTFLTPFIFYTKTSEVFEFNKMVTVYIFTVLIVGIWITRIILRKKIIFRRTILDFPIMLFLGSQLLATIFSIDTHTSFFGYYSRFNGGLLSLLCYFLLYWAYVSNISKKQTLVILKLLFVSAGIISAYAALEHFGVSPSCLFITGSLGVNCWAQDVNLRVFATFGQPNWLAAWLVAIIPFTWVMAEDHGKAGGKKTIIYLSLGILMFAALLFTKSRSGILAFLISFAIYWSVLIFRMEKSRQTINQLLLPASCILLATALIGTPWTPSASAFLNPKPAAVIDNVPPLAAGITESGEIRRIVWRGALEVWKNNPVFGSGVETFAFSYYSGRPLEHNSISEWNFLYNKAHNEYLNFAATSGSVGFISYIILIAATLFIFIRNLKSSIANSKSNNKFKILNLGLLAGYVSILITNFFGFSVVAVNLLFFLYPAMAVVVADGKKQNVEWRRILSADNKQKILISLVVLVSLYLLLATARYWYADTLYAKGLSLNKDGNHNGALNVLTRAIELSPDEALYHDELAQSYAGVAEASRENSDSLQFAQLAANELAAAESLSPNNIKILKSAAHTYSALSEVKKDYIFESKRILQTLTVLAPTDASVYYSHALTSAKLGQNSDAIRMLGEAIEMKPDYTNAYIYLAVLLAEQGDKTKARELLDFLDENVSPNNPNAELVIKEYEL